MDSSSMSPSPQQVSFFSPFKLDSNSSTTNLPMTPEWNITSNFYLDDAPLLTGNDSTSSKSLKIKCKGLLDVTRKGKSIAKNFKRRIKQQILGDLGTSEGMIDTIFRNDPPARKNTSETFPQVIEIKSPSNNAKLQLFEPELMQSMLDSNYNRDYQNQNAIERKFFNQPTYLLHDAKSPNIRERCLKSAETFKSHFMFNLPIPITSKKILDNTNPFRELTRYTSELDLGNTPKRANSIANTMLDYSRSPAVIMRTSGRLESFGDYCELPNKTESRFETEFQVLEEIGKGHFAVVKRCKNRLDGLEYAVKITNNKWRSECGKSEALQEVFALSALSVCDDNPYIVKYFYGWIEDSKLHIVVIQNLNLD
jgi:hypothetical protein